MATWKEKFNKKYNHPKGKSHSLSDVAKQTGVSKKGIQQIYNKGIGAYKTNPQSVRPNVTSKEQWAMARVYSSVMGGKASKVDAKELKMEMGGGLKNFYKGYYERLSPSNFDVKQNGGQIQINMNKNGAVDIHEEAEALSGGFFKKGGETDFNPDGQIKDKIVHASGDAGGMLVGKRHSNGGIKALNKSTGQPLEMEGGEVVITRNAVSDNKKRSFNGKMLTNRQILSEINESGGGVSFADGGQVPNDVKFDCNAEYEYGGKTMCGKDLAYAMGGVTTAIVTDPNEAMADLQSTYGLGDVYAKGGIVWKKNIGDEGWSSTMESNNAYENEGGYISENGNWKIYRSGRFYKRGWGENFERRGQWGVYREEEFYGDFESLSDAKNYVNTWIAYNPNDYAKGGEVKIPSVSFEDKDGKEFVFQGGKFAIFDLPNYRGAWKNGQGYSTRKNAKHNIVLIKLDNVKTDIDRVFLDEERISDNGFWFNTLREYPSVSQKYEGKLYTHDEGNINKFIEKHFGRFYAKGGTIECGSCSWSWDEKDGGDDMYVCHKCGTDNTSKYDDSKSFDKAREELGKEYLENLDKFAEGGQLQTDEFPDNLDEATFIKDLGGSTGAKLYEYKGKEFVLKLGATSGQSYDEFLANQIYYLLDVPVPRSSFVGGSVVKEFIGKERDVDYNEYSDLKLIAKGYVADALLGNWDIYKNDNIIIKEGTISPFRIDSGGSLRYRARGEEKENFGREVTELETLKENNPKLKPYITDKVIKNGIEKVIKEKENILDLFKDDGRFRIKMEGRISYLEGVLNEIDDRRGVNFVEEDLEVEPKKEVVETKEPSFEEKFLVNKISELRKRYEIKKRYLSEIQKGIALRDIRKFEIALDEIRLNNTSFLNLLENFINSTTVEFGDVNEKRTPRKGKSISGEKSELTKKEYDAVRSESFINWFGDWEVANETGNYEGVSKIINSETKEPLVVYHGTDTKFISWETYAKNNLHYFAKKKRFADFFATSWQERTDDAGVKSAEIKSDNPIKGTFVYSCFLDIKNPIDFTPFGIDKVPFNDYLKYLEIKYELDLSRIEGYNDLKDRTEKVYSWVVIRKWQQFNLFIKNNTPYDGFSFYEFIPDSQRRGFEDASLSFTAFNSNQIKFTNNTSFSKFTDDSRLEVGGIIF